MKPMKPYLLSVATFLAIDALWLSLMTPLVYSPALGSIISQKPRLSAVLIFYLLFAIILVKLVVEPAIKLNQRTMTVAVRAALFGVASYGTYELTNYATIAEWPLHIVFIDIIWGGLLASIVASIVFHMTRPIS